MTQMGQEDTKQEFEEQTEEITICVIGKAGDGKSTMLNRFCGDTSKKGNQGPFKTGISTTSVTQDVQSMIKTLSFTEPELEHLNGVFVHLIDTPGLADSEGNDKLIVDKVKHFFEKVCKGVNVFLLLFNVTIVRYDTKVQNFLYLLSMVFGSGFWKHVMLVFVRHDINKDGDYDNEDKYKNAVSEYPQRIKKQFNLDFNLSVTGFGKNNWIKGICDIVSFGNKKGKFICEYMKSWEEAGGVGSPEQRLKEKQELMNQLSLLSEQMLELEQARQDQIKKHNQEMKELKKIHQKTLNTSKKLYKEQQEQMKKMQQIHQQKMKEMELKRMEEQKQLQLQIKEDRERRAKEDKRFEQMMKQQNENNQKLLQEIAKQNNRKPQVITNTKPFPVCLLM